MPAYDRFTDLETYDSIRARVADSICDECGYACWVHMENCSHKGEHRCGKHSLTYRGICPSCIGEFGDYS